jgi:hypothetical protein
MDWLRARFARFWMIVAAHALPHLPVPAIGGEFKNDETLVTEGRNALLWWIGLSLALWIFNHPLFAIAYFAFGFSKMRRWSQIARKAGFGPGLLG